MEFIYFFSPRKKERKEKVLRDMDDINEIKEASCHLGDLWPPCFFVVVVVSFFLFLFGWLGVEDSEDPRASVSFGKLLANRRTEWHF